MLLNLSMRLEKILILSSILLIFIVACSSIDNINTADSCIIFEEKRSWYKSTKNSYTKWGTPISLQLAIINQESSFKQFAKPKRKRLLGLIPGSRPSSAFGYAQVTNPTWDWYKNRTGNSNASRANFKDITDFIGWYTTQTENILGISKQCSRTLIITITSNVSSASYLSIEDGIRLALTLLPLWRSSVELLYLQCGCFR